MTRRLLAVFALLILSACPGRQTPKQPDDDPGPARDDGGSETSPEV